MKYADEDRPQPACDGQHEIFWSRFLADHQTARAICEGDGDTEPCPLLATCSPGKHSQADGTYGGILFINGKPQKWGNVKLTAEQQTLLGEVSAALGVDPTHLLEPSYQATKTRHLAAYILTVKYGMSSTAVGKVLCRDHTSVLNSIRRVNERPEWLAKVTALMQAVA